jgi:hypothetical protein
MNIKDKPVVNFERVRKPFEKDISWPEGSPDEIIKFMENLKCKYKDCEDLVVEYYWSGYEQCDYQIRGWELETDQEMQDRIEHEKIILREWEQDYVAWMEIKGKEKAEKEAARIAEQLRQFNLLKDKLEKAGALPK